MAVPLDGIRVIDFRAASKQPATPTQGNSLASDQGQVQCCEFDTDGDDFHG